MAPRVDRTVDSMSPRQVELAGSVPQGIGPETDRDLERTPNPFGHRSPICCHSSRVKVQLPRRLRSSSGIAARGGRLAQLVRALP